MIHPLFADQIPRSRAEDLRRDAELARPLRTVRRQRLRAWIPVRRSPRMPERVLHYDVLLRTEAREG